MTSSFKKVSEETGHNLFWYFDERNPKMLINLLKLYESHINVESNRLFADFKKKTVKNYMERGFYPNTLMGEISKADEDYQVLKEMFKLQ
jgi:hypothetical protein